MNTGSMKTLLKRYGFDDGDPLVDWLNGALHEFEDYHPWPFLEAYVTIPVAAGAGTIVVPSDFFKVLSLKIDGISGQLEYMPIAEFEEETSDLTSTGLPQCYTLIGLSSFILWPVPDAPISLRLLYRKSLPDLVADGDVPGIPLKWHYLLPRGAAATALQSESEEDRSSTARTEFEAGLMTAVNSLSTRQGQEPPGVRDTQGYNYGS